MKINSNFHLNICTTWPKGPLSIYLNENLYVLILGNKLNIDLGKIFLRKFFKSRVYKRFHQKRKKIQDFLELNFKRHEKPWNNLISLKVRTWFELLRINALQTFSRIKVSKIAGFGISFKVCGLWTIRHEKARLKKQTKIFILKFSELDISRAENFSQRSRCSREENFCFLFFNDGETCPIPGENLQVHLYLFCLRREP